MAESISNSSADAAPATPQGALTRYSSPGEKVAYGVLVVLTVMVYLYLRAFRVWWPHDDGMLAHTAERVLNGELPHHDFDEVYTGGLSMLHALALAVWGVKLSSLRWMLLLASVPFVATLYALAVRRVTPAVAALVTWLAVAWSLGNYFVAMPSWYNLFLATFGIWALLKFLDTRRASWLACAGAFGGCSLLIKVIGAYYVAGAVLFLINDERRGAESGQPSRQRSFVYSLGVCAALLVFVTALVALVKDNFRAFEVLVYVVPGSLLAGYLGWAEWRFGRGSCGERIRSLAARIGPFGLGVCIPIALFLLPYVSSGATTSLVEGVFLLPLRRLTEANFPLPPLVTILAGLPLAALILIPCFGPVRWRPLAVDAVCVGLVLWLIACGINVNAYTLAWMAIRPIVLILVLATVVLLVRGALGSGPAVAWNSEMLLMSTMAALLSLVQYPFSSPLYFVYVAPVVVLAATYVMMARPLPPSRLEAAVLAFLLLFAVIWLNRSALHVFGFRYETIAYDSPLVQERGGIQVAAHDQALYGRLQQLVDAHSAPDSYIYAAPDCPEVYFLTGRKNPTRTIYDLFDDPTNRTSRILQALNAHAVRVVVINQTHFVSPEIDPTLFEALESRFPHQAKINRFTVRWRDLPATSD